MIATFLPGEAMKRGIQPGSVGWIYATQPLGTFIGTFAVPLVLHAVSKP